MVGKLRLGVLISGRGSNLQALIDAASAPDFPAEIAVVLSNKPDAYGLTRAEQAGISTHVIPTKGQSKADFESKLDQCLRDAKVDLICLAGFMRVLTGDFLTRWQDRVINIHPSLLPAFPGLHTHERALESGVRFAGCTVHYVRAEVDAGPILLQAAVPVLDDDTPDDLAARILIQEHRLYPEAVRLIADGKTQINGNRVLIKA
jgi:phosphoribosylglycinamide formyltransferase 1